MTRLELPWPPSVNHYWRLGNGHFYISRGGQRYKLAACGILATAGIRPLTGPVKVTLDAFPPDRRRRDLDNLEKCVWDSCVLRRGFSTGLFHDDSQIKRKICTMWDYDPNQPGRIVITIEPWRGVEPVGVPVDRSPPHLFTAALDSRPAGESS